MSSSVLDASALLALLNDEPGADLVTVAIAQGAAIGAVNLSEVVAKLADAGTPETSIREAIDPLGLNVVEFNADLAYETGAMRPTTRALGLPLGDRACLALGRHLGLPILTTDRTWLAVGADISVRTIR